MKLRKIKTLLISIILIAITILLINKTYAYQVEVDGETYDVIPETVPAGTVPPDSFELRSSDVTPGRFYPHRIVGEMFYCINHRVGHNASLEWGWYEGQKEGEGHDDCGAENPEPPWPFIKKSMEYTRMDPKINFTTYQDAAYVFAEGHHDEEAAYAVWSTLLNLTSLEPIDAFGEDSMGVEAATYKSFFETTHEITGTHKPYREAIINNSDVSSASTAEEREIERIIKNLGLDLTKMTSSKELQDLVIAEIKTEDVERAYWGSKYYKYDNYEDRYEAWYKENYSSWYTNKYNQWFRPYYDDVLYDVIFDKWYWANYKEMNQNEYDKLYKSKYESLKRSYYNTYYNRMRNINYGYNSSQSHETKFNNWYEDFYNDIIYKMLYDKWYWSEHTEKNEQEYNEGYTKKAEEIKNKYYEEYRKKLYGNYFGNWYDENYEDRKEDQEEEYDRFIRNNYRRKLAFINKYFKEQAFVKVEGNSYNYYEGAQAEDIFEDLLEDNTVWPEVKTRVKRDEKHYVVGPFNMSYPSGVWEDINKFSWVKDVRILDQDDNFVGSILGGNLEIIDKNGKKIMDTVVKFDSQGKAIYGQKLNVPKNGEDFYVKFVSDTVTDITVNIDFGYLEQCESLAYRYKGYFYGWKWEKENTTKHDYIYDYDEDGDPIYKKCQKWTWVLQKEIMGRSQTLAAVLSARKIYKEATLVIPTQMPEEPDRPDKRIDVTMDIAGRVFLDQDQGKANQGNNKYDNGEELADIDVWLYRKDGQLIDVTVTDSEGNYLFKRINAQKEYYVQFVYNGMLYTNVAYQESGDDTSKSTETAQGHENNRTNFNNKFAEISSHPQNYKTKDCINGADITNKIFMQDDLVTLFKEIANETKNSKSIHGKDELDGNRTASVSMSSVYQTIINRHSSDPDIRAKVQYIEDCRIKAYSVKQYSEHNAFKIDEKEDWIGSIHYTKIYYEQKNVNLGIKGRPTFDMALYKDTVKADVLINGKQETYTYDERKAKGNPFTVGVSETDYLNGLRSAYVNSKNYQNDETRPLETDTYDTDLRAEEVANAQVTDYINQGKKVDQKYNVKGINEYANYTNLDLQNGTNKDERLKIFVQYRISVRNQSGVIGAITEVTDYFDPNFKFVDAYEGDINGNKIANVNKFDTSMYGTATEYKNDSKYTTIYLRPEKENRLHNDNKEQYIYVTLQLLGSQNDAGDFLKGRLLNDQNVAVLNVAEINGYKTYDALQGNSTPGLVDIDSNPGSFNISNIKELNEDNIKKYASIYEDDTSRAPAMIYKLLESRTIEGTVFEDSTGKDSDKLNTAKVREGNGVLDKGEKGIKDVIVQLVEIKNGQMITRAQTRTNGDGWYGFTGFVPGNYTIRYIYGADDKTAMTTSSWYAGSNGTSYNGQDYQSTKFTATEGGNLTDKAYKTDANLVNRYKVNYDNKDNVNKPIESTVNILENTTIRQYQDAFYWYTNTKTAYSDAQDDDYRKQLVINYAKQEYGTEVANYKAEVFNSYMPRDKQPSYMTDAYMRQLANELERRTYRYAYTPEITVEVEYAKKTDTGNKSDKKGYEHAIKGIDFGVVERPKAKIELTKNVSHLKVKTTDGTVLFDTSERTSNLAWTVKKNRYKETDPILITMDDELLNGATIEITYKFTVTNNSELGEEGNSVIAAKTLIDYVDNSLTFNIEDNRGMWEVVSPDSIQNDTKATMINNYKKEDSKTKDIDLSTIQTIVKATQNNPLTKNLAVGETTEGTLVLTKVLASESDIAQLTYDNIAEIVETKQIVGRYDHTSTPGNQKPEGNNAEDDTYRAETVKILPPFGDTSITMYFIIGTIALAILGGGVFLIKKFVVHK